ncbi:hypothetical protein ACJMK2_010147 [Sinanodonta woodiana]|uniref:Uncharacterized protein n=1 Tax=Sinanodonta woodiana TaxID=1069815 RepID=A0ABD3VEF2_SINWO
MAANTLEVQTDTDKFTLKGRTCEYTAFSFVPTHRNDPLERTFYNTPERSRKPSSTYDRLFRKELDYNNKLHRDDREHAKSKGLKVNDEEKQKKVPTLSSSEYGHRLNMFVDHHDRKHVRIARVKAEFLRRNGIAI